MSLILGYSRRVQGVYKGSTPDARGVYNRLKREHPLSFPCTPLVHGVQMELAGLKTMEMPGGAVGLAHIPARSVCRQRANERETGWIRQVS